MFSRLNLNGKFTYTFVTFTTTMIDKADILFALGHRTIGRDADYFPLLLYF